MKSILLINGNAPKDLLNSTLYGADALAYDLYDAVDETNKDAGRLLLQEALQFFDFGETGVYVRVNPMSTCGAKDIAVAGRGRPQAFILPDADAKSLPAADAAIAELESASGFAAESIKLIPMIASAHAVEHAGDLVASCKRIIGAIFDAKRFLQSLGVPENDDPGQVLYARSKVALACRAAGIEAIDRPYANVKNAPGLEADARVGKGLGYTGKLAVSGGQVPLINEIFA